MNYIVVTSQNGKSYYLAKQRIGGGYTTIATFTNEQFAKDTCDVLNMKFDKRTHAERVTLREVKK